MKKRLISLLLIVCMVVTLLPVTVLADGGDIGSMIRSYTKRYKYDYSPITFEIVWENAALEEGTHYTISYWKAQDNPTVDEPIVGTPSEIGEYQFTITGLDPYTGSYSGNFCIYDPRDLSNAEINLERVYLHTGQPVKLEVIEVKSDGWPLYENHHYTISYRDENSNNLTGAPTDIGAYYAIFEGKDPYSGEKEEAFSIKEAKRLIEAEFSLEHYYAYTGEPVVIDLTVTFGGQVLLRDTDYTVKYSTNSGEELSPPPRDIGQYQLEITGKGEYTGTFGSFFFILEASDFRLADVSMTDTYECTGYPVVISGLTVKLGGQVLTRDTDYEVGYFDKDWNEIAAPTDVGEYNVLLMGIGTYNGNIILPFTIIENTTPVTNWIDYVKNKPPGYTDDGNTITIYNEEGLAWLASVVNGLNGESADDLSGKTVTLMANLDLSAYDWTPIGRNGQPFAGTFEGNGNSISGIRVTDVQYAGLFGYSSGTVKNLTVSGRVEATGGGNNYGYAGGIAGYLNNGTVTNCHNTCEVITAGGEYSYAGGIVGYQNGGIVTNCCNTNKVTATNRGSYLYAGGLVGRLNNGTVANCCNTGEMSVSSASKNGYAGGIVAYIYSGTITNSYNTGKVYRYSDGYSGGLAGIIVNSTTVANCYWLNTVMSVGIGLENWPYVVTNCGSFTEAEGKGEVATFEYKIDTEPEYGNLRDALNAWVQSQDPQDGYMDWVYFPGTDYPVHRPCYRVTFESNGGTAVSDLVVFYGATAIQPADPTKTGYTFGGWYKDEGFTEAWDFASDTVTSNMTLYARWMPSEGTAYTVEHYQQDIVGDSHSKVDADTENKTGTTGDTVVAEAKTYTGFTENVGHQDRIPSGIVAADGSLVLRLYYDRNLYTVSFESNGGTAVSDLLVFYEATASQPVDPTKTGYTFAGWYKDSGLETAWDFASVTVTSNMTLYARWTVIPSSPSSGSSNNITAIMPPSTTEEPDPPTLGIIKPIAKVDAKGRVIMTVTLQDMMRAIMAARALAEREGNTGNGIGLSIDLSALQTSFNTLPLTLGKGVYQALVDAGVRVLEIKTPQLSLSLDLETLKTILQNMGSQITIAAELIDPETLTDEMKSVLGARPAYRLSIAYGDDEITDFGDGRIGLYFYYVPGEGEEAPGLFAVYVDEAGGMEWLWNSGYNPATQTLQFWTGHFSTFGIGYREIPDFTDITGHWAKEDIEYVALRDLMKGTGDRIFSPDLFITRGMVVTVLWRMERSPKVAYGADFSDVAGGAWYEDAVSWAGENKIVTGYGNGSFGPNDTLSREQMATILFRYANYKGYDVSVGGDTNILSYKDAFDISEYAMEAMQWMCGAGLMQGSGGNLMPRGDASRAQVAAILHRFIEKYRK